MSWNLRHRFAQASRFWRTLAFRLTAWYVLAGLALVVFTSASLYFVLVTELKKSMDLFLADKIHVLRTMLRERPDDWDGRREEIPAILYPSSGQTKCSAFDDSGNGGAIGSIAIDRSNPKPSGAR